MKPDLSLLGFQLSMDLSACTHTCTFSSWRIKEAFYLFGYMLNCIKLLHSQSSQRKGFGLAWPAQYFNGSISGDNGINLLDLPLLFFLCALMLLCLLYLGITTERGSGFLFLCGFWGWLELVGGRGLLGAWSIAQGALVVGIVFSSVFTFRGLFLIPCVAVKCFQCDACPPHLHVSSDVLPAVGSGSPVQASHRGCWLWF